MWLRSSVAVAVAVAVAGSCSSDLTSSLGTSTCHTVTKKYARAHTHTHTHVEASHLIKAVPHGQWEHNSTINSSTEDSPARAELHLRGYTSVIIRIWAISTPLPMGHWVRASPCRRFIP